MTMLIVELLAICDIPWYSQPVKDLNVDSGDINDGASLIVLTDGGDDAMSRRMW